MLASKLSTFGMDAEKSVRQKWRLLKATLNERARRLWAGVEADAIGYGGVVAVARATGMAISTVRKGRDEARAGARPDDVIKVRRSTGKRPYEVARPEVWPALEKLVDPVTRGDPESPLRWTCKSTHVLSTELFAQHGIRELKIERDDFHGDWNYVIRPRTFVR